ncbi:MAG: DNA ligase D [Candidatus Omnitrophota bacterium]
MSLKEYHDKRDFSSSPEPQGGKTARSDKLFFVIQKHDASHLHYDLRLEYFGVMTSWAIPKGLPRDENEKHLAIQVEDHPLEYRNFEGVIPKGYGAGTVMIWDEGTYRIDGDVSEDKEKIQKQVREGLEKGHLKVELNGKKVSGQYSLVRMKKGAPHQWLIFKKKPSPLVTEQQENLSVRTGRTMEEIEKGEYPSSTLRLSDEDLKGAQPGPVPMAVSPMLATLVEDSFDQEGWIFEMKWDGYRVMTQINKQGVRLYSRNDKDFNSRFPEVVESLRHFPHECLLDGEMVVVDGDGHPRFHLLQDYMKKREGILLYYVFDLLYINGYDLRKLPLWRRRNILQKILPEHPYVKFSDGIERMGRAFFDIICINHLEGMIAKDLSSPYRTGKRTKDWLKVKAIMRQEAVIAGLTEPRGSRKKFGALVLGVYDDGLFRYIGHTGGGFDDYLLNEIYRKVSPLITDKSPFDPPPKTNTPVRWAKPQVVCEVKFSEWTGDGLMRHPVFLGLREDKNAHEVHQESPDSESMKKVSASYRQRKEQVLRFQPTHMDKVFWPEEGYTKGDLIHYYEEAAEIMLPYLKDRPQALNRFPDGIKGESFFQKDVDHQGPDWVKTVPVESENRDKTIRYLVCQDLDTLIYVANLGCIEVNVWNARYQHPLKPDYAVIDFDPLDVEFSSVVEVVLETKKFLDNFKITSFCKTSGAKGMHLYIPFNQARYTAEQVTDFAKIICLNIHERLPGLTSLERSPQKRKGCVYLDYLQNARHRTMAAPYCVRPRPGATVSAPLFWEEVTGKLHPSQFTMKNMPARIKSVGDPWKKMFSQGISMQQAIASIGKD